MKGRIKKLLIFTSSIQMVVGIITIIISVLFLMGKLGKNIAVCAIPVIICCLLACINMCIYIKNAKRE